VAIVETVVLACWERAAGRTLRKIYTVRIAGLTRAEYAMRKQLLPDVLRGCRLSEPTDRGKLAVHLRHDDKAGNDAATDTRMRAATRSLGVLLVEKQSGSDGHTFWTHGEPAIGVSGSGNWTESRYAPPLEGIPTVYAVMELDAWGVKWTFHGSPICGGHGFSLNELIAPHQVGCDAGRCWQG
jgi:hypothetical protein